MSLLNDMLRDLSHQQTTVETAATANQAALDFNAQEQRELFYNTRAVKPLPRTLVPSLVVFVLVLAILVLWKLNFFSQTTTDTTATPSATDQTIVEPAPVKQIESTTVEQTTQQETSAAEPVPEAIDSRSVAPELGERIAALESAITNLSVVVANANNQPVNQSTNVETTPNEPLVPVEQSDASISPETPESVSIQEPFATAATEPVAESLAIPPVEEREPQLSIAPNVKWIDQQQAQQANQLVVQGQVDIAIAKLQNFIATANQPRESVKTLLDIFATQENTGAMQALVAQADYLSVVEQTFYEAKIASIQQQDARAIQLLEAHLGEAERNENYRGLLAGLYQRTGMNLEAANHYRRLLSVFGDKPAYWLGFALAQDALNQPQVAAQAYQRVNQYADLQPQVRTYVQQRIAALQQ
jgi:tetratricopeptide (TPR) repeat protein